MINVVYSSDDNYAHYLGISLLSFLKNNQEIDRINIFIIENNITDKNKNDIKKICKTYNAFLEFISIQKIKDKLNKYDIFSYFPLACYSTILLPTLLPNEIDKIIYIDCDTLITNSFKKLWDLDISHYYCAGVLDILYKDVKKIIGIPDNYNYINAGFLYINLKKWREDNIEERCLKILEENHTKIRFADQDILNFAFNNNILILPPKYDLFCMFLEINYEDIQGMYGLENYYSKEEIEKSIENPVLYHFIPSFLYGKVWEKNINNPLYYKYKEYVDISPWKEDIFTENKKILNGKIPKFMFSHLPKKILYNYHHFMLSISYPKFKNKIKLLRLFFFCKH